jgi:hypothetical protein
MSEQAPSKERIHPCPHGHTPDLCRLCMRAEIERLDSALTSSRGETARACQEYREVLAENTKLKRAAHEPSQTSNEKVARLRALFDDRTKDFRRSHSEALFNEYARLERELETANRTIAHFLGPEGEKYIDRFAAMLAGPVSLDESLRRYSPPEPCPNCEKLGQLLATTLDGEDGIIVATGSKGRDEKLFSANDIRVFTAIGFALRKKHEADRASYPTTTGCSGAVLRAGDYRRPDRCGLRRRGISRVQAAKAQHLGRAFRGATRVENASDLPACHLR